jgi:hypothetical protein
MKKTAKKKLVLNRETLAGLDPSRYGQVAGGTGYTCPSFTCQPPCQFSDGRDTCFTCEATCTTNYC